MKTRLSAHASTTPHLAAATVFGISSAFAIEFHDPIVLDSPNIAEAGSFGNAVAALNDVNDDGVADFAISAPWEDPPGSPSDAGRVYVFDGATRAVLREIKTPFERNNGNFGRTLTPIADLNGNGSTDLIVTGSGSALGVLYVMDSKTGEQIHSFTGSWRKGAAIPDTNGDGVPDILLNNTNPNTPMVALYDGATGSRLYGLSSPVSQSRTFFGSSIAGVQDTNGDGLGDILVSAAWENLTKPGFLSNAGAIHLFDGAEGDLIRSIYPPRPQAGSEFEGIGLPDVNGDGFGEIAGRDVAGNLSYVLDGQSGARLYGVVPPRIDNVERFGVKQAIPDSDGDGIHDLLASGFGDDVASRNVYVHDGTNGEILGQVHFGTDSHVHLPTALSDVNGDGLPEILVGVPYTASSAGHFEGGVAFLFLSKAHDSGSLDPDGDGLTNDEEAALGTDPEVADSDSDGFSDGAEVDAGTDPNDPNVFPILPDSDHDRDGFTYAEEDLFGSDPEDAASRPQFELQFDQEANRLVVTLLSAPGRIYELEQSPDGTSFTTVPGSARTGDGGILTLAIENPAAPTLLLRVRARIND